MPTDGYVSGYVSVVDCYRPPVNPVISVLSKTPTLPRPIKLRKLISASIVVVSLRKVRKSSGRCIPEPGGKRCRVWLPGLFKAGTACSEAAQ